MNATLTMSGAPTLALVQRMVGTVSISASAVRRAGSSGVVAAARDHVSQLPLAQFTCAGPSEFAAVLERSTRDLMAALPPGAQSWGVARKCLNIFLRDALYNWYLRTHFDLGRAEPWLEAPLDGIVARALREQSIGTELPAWPGVKHLTPEINRAYQAVAGQFTQGHGVHRVHLDLYLWLSGRP